MQVILLTGAGAIVLLLVLFFTWKQTTDDLEAEQSMARWGMVVLAEGLAFIVFCVPLILPFLFSGILEPWRKYCLLVGLTTAFIVLVFLTAFPAIPRVIVSDKATVRSIECMVVAVYAINTIGLCFAIVLTGGPARSFYANLLPIQLAGFLLLEVQKERWIHKNRENRKDLPEQHSIEQNSQRSPLSQPLIYVFTALTLLAVCTTYYLRNRFSVLPNDLEFAAWITYLNIAGVFLTLAGYFLPRQRWFIEKIGHRRSRSTESAK
jgi:hypothetical protein